MSGRLRTIGALTKRALNEIIRVPTGALPGVLAPTIFMLGLSAVFGAAAHLRGFGNVDSFRTFIVPVGLLQGAGFTGAATGVNLARDIEGGWFDRLLVAPVSRPTLLTGIVMSASLRALLPTTFLLVVAFALGVRWPGVDGLLIAYALVMLMAAAMACFAVTVALRFRTQQAAPLMQMGNFVLSLFTTSYAPYALLAGWLQVIADINPVTNVLAGARQGFIASVTWADTWPAILSVLGMLVVFGGFALRGMNRQGVNV
ncbi:MAG: type transport system permease protein [Baekduia sp.]|jgi:ABC-2 type transport system permease protein|nr:type transport system permease protein [Baekduia sp.]